MKGTCKDCQFWLPSDPGRDGGRLVIGSCLAIKGYDDTLEKVRNKSPNRWNDEEVYALLREQAKVDRAYVQTDDGNPGAVRCTSDHYCSLFSPMAKQVGEFAKTVKRAS